MWQEGIAGQLEAVEIMTVEDIMDVGLAAPFTLAGAIVLLICNPSYHQGSYSRLVKGRRDCKGLVLDTRACNTFSVSVFNSRPEVTRQLKYSTVRV